MKTSLPQVLVVSDRAVMVKAIFKDEADIITALSADEALEVWRTHGDQIEAISIDPAIEGGPELLAELVEGYTGPIMAMSEIEIYVPYLLRALQSRKISQKR